MHKKLHMAGLSAQDLANWEEFCRKNQLSKHEFDQNRRKSSQGRGGYQVRENLRGSLSTSDLADWEEFCQNNELPQNSLPAEKQQEIVDKPPSRRKKIATPVKPKPGTQLANSPSQHNIDPKIRKRLLAGTLDPERTLDLHGMLRDEASDEVRRFVLGAYNAGKRLILVIPGKGRDDFGRRGFGPLNQLLKSLLSSPPTSQYILHFQTAHQHHGGTGAYYIYLKRNRTPR